MGPLDHCKSGMPRLAEEEEQMLHSTNGSSSAPNSILVSNVGTLSTKPASPRVPAPQMPPAPASLSPEQQKRRHIVASLVHSENSYVATLQRLVNVSLCFHSDHSLHLLEPFKNTVNLGTPLGIDKSVITKRFSY